MTAGLLDAASWLLLVTGSMFAVIGGIGLVRLPDFYTRIHACGITDTMGAWLVLLGLMLQAGPSLSAVKLMMILAFLIVTSPTSGHAVAKAAYLDGLRAELDLGDDEDEGDASSDS